MVHALMHRVHLYVVHIVYVVCYIFVTIAFYNVFVYDGQCCRCVSIVLFLYSYENKCSRTECYHVFVSFKNVLFCLIFVYGGFIVETYVCKRVIYGLKRRMFYRSVMIFVMNDTYMLFMITHKYHILKNK